MASDLAVMLKQIQKTTGMELGGSHLDRIISLHSQLVKLRQKVGERAGSSGGDSVSPSGKSASSSSSSSQRQPDSAQDAERTKIDAAIRKQIGDPEKLPPDMRAQLEREIAEKLGVRWSAAQKASGPPGNYEQRSGAPSVVRQPASSKEKETASRAAAEAMQLAGRAARAAGRTRIGSAIARGGSAAASGARRAGSAAARTRVGGAIARGGAAVASRVGLAGASAAAGSSAAAAGGTAAAGGAAAAAGAGTAAAALGPVALAATAAALTLGALVVATKKVSDAFSGVADGIENVSPAVASARAVNERRSEMSRIDRSQEIGPQLAQLEAARGRASDALYGLGTDILEILLRFAPLFEAGVDGITAVIEVLRLVKESVDVGLTIIPGLGMDREQEQKEAAQALSRLESALAEFFRTGVPNQPGGLDEDLKTLLRMRINEGPRRVAGGGREFIPNEDL